MAETPYNEKLEAEDQVAAEEAIAQHLFQYFQADRNQPGGEEDAAQLGRDLLLLVLKRFRGDLFEGDQRCEYTDCANQNPIAVQERIESERVTCEKCRTDMGLPPIAEDS